MGNNLVSGRIFRIHIILLLLILFCPSCRNNDQLFTLLDKRHTGITFLNNVEYTEEFNTYTYRNFYNGAGVGIADFNCDGLQDIYFCGNLLDNKLYINKGNFRFEDITEKAGVECHDVWSTGVSIADVNGDGFPDIYVCKSGNPRSGNRKNELFINNGDLTFTNKAEEYGLDILGLSNNASFFDYDRDGDLDCYLLSNSFKSVSEFEIKPGQREIIDSLGGNRLYRNDNGHFTDVTREAGIYGSKIGFGLGVSISDLNRDGWPDIYISNDFFERDYLYINNCNGTFRESLEEEIRETSQGAMGSDIADINNDTWPDIFVTEMTPEGNARMKTKAVFDIWERYQQKVKDGYYHQFARNTLQLNNQNGSFSEIGRFSGISKTDWSWGALIMDMDNDGWNDIFVANGIYKDLLDRDFLDFYSDPSIVRTMIRTNEKAILAMIDQIPSKSVPNYAFHNNRDLTFTNYSERWGLNTPSFSNGAAYGDLDNDGDLDLIVNNVNMEPFIYRNDSKNNGKNNYLIIKLEGSGNNKDAIGSAVTVYSAGLILFREQFPARGFQSCSDKRLHFGLGQANSIDSVVVGWPGGKKTKLCNIKVNQIVTINQNKAVEGSLEKKNFSPLFQEFIPPGGPDFIHIENNFDEFARDKLLFQMISNEGPHLAIADVNGDGLDDVYACGAKDTPGKLFIQDSENNFRSTNEILFSADKISEDTDCAFFDADGDDDPDLYVTSGGNEFPSSSSALSDRLYINDGKGNFSKSTQILPAGKYVSTSCVKPSDFDKDGDIDLFVGTRLLPFSYGLPVNGFLLENDGKGNFTDVTAKKAPGLLKAGMITDMVWADVDNDDDPDMIICGDWMPIKIFINNNGKFANESESRGLANTEGWWHRIVPADLNSDGFVDFVAGNNGLNSFFRASVQSPLLMYVNDFDLNGSIEQLICSPENKKYFPVPLRDDLVKQIPYLKGKYKTYADYKDQSVEDIFSEDVLKNSVKLSAKMMESCVLMNNGNGSFKIISLPAEAQFTPVYAIAADDFDRDGTCDIIIGGNQYYAKPETGINDAGYGLFLKGIDGRSWRAVLPGESGLFIKGEIRDIRKLKINNDQIITVARNNNSLLFFKY
jgi:hypothetical protein